MHPLLTQPSSFLISSVSILRLFLISSRLCIDPMRIGNLCPVLVLNRLLQNLGGGAIPGSSVVALLGGPAGAFERKPTVLSLSAAPKPWVSESHISITKATLYRYVDHPNGVLRRRP